MKNITQALEWRYATKQYDASKKIQEEHVKLLKDSVRLAPSSFGLQPFRVVDVKDPEIREKLKAVSWNQSQITDASELYVFAVPTDITDEDIDTFAKLTAEVRGITVESMSGYISSIKGSVKSKTPEERSIWAAKQAYIALGFLLETAALLEVDATPMEGFDGAQYDAILGLTEKNLKSAVVCALGYRSEDDHHAQLPKVRMTDGGMFMTV